MKFYRVTLSYIKEGKARTLIDYYYANTADEAEEKALEEHSEYNNIRIFETHVDRGGYWERV